jgi:hypothetical protein
VNEVNQYISQNISVLDLEEIAQQAAEMLSSAVEQQCTAECIKRHINEHTQEPRIIVSLLLRDIRNVVDEVRHCSRTVDEDGKVCLDKTNMLLYKSTRDKYRLSQRQNIAKDQNRGRLQRLMWKKLMNFTVTGSMI